MSTKEGTEREKEPQTSAQALLLILPATVLLIPQYYNISSLENTSSSKDREAHIMHLLCLPRELRDLIYRFSFPLPNTRVQLFPYDVALSVCRLHLPLSLYLVCKQIQAEMPSLSVTLRSLDPLYTIECYKIEDQYHMQVPPDDEHTLLHLCKRLSHAERIRLVGSALITINSEGKRMVSILKPIVSGYQCALRILEIEPVGWDHIGTAQTLIRCFTALTAHPDVSDRLDIRLIRDIEKGNFSLGEEDSILDKTEDWLENYQRLDMSQRFGLMMMNPYNLRAKGPLFLARNRPRFFRRQIPAILAKLPSHQREAFANILSIF